MRTLEATGKSIDEAIFNGLRELQISIDEVEIDIIQQETKGVFGIGAKPAIVRLIEREPEEVVIPDYIANKDKPRERRPRRSFFPSNLFLRISRATSGRRTIRTILPMSRGFSRICSVR